VNRIGGVDGMRFFAIIAVIMLHTTPFKYSSETAQIYPFLNLLINQTSKFAVPFFFIASGYFWGRKLESGHDVAVISAGMIKRLVIIFLGWSLIYIMPYNLTSVITYGILGPIKISYWNLERLAASPLTPLSQGTKIHLWFLIALVNSVAICWFFVKKDLKKHLAPCGLTLYLIGLLAKSYMGTPLGFSINFDTRNGPFFGTLFFITGYYLRNKRVSLRVHLFQGIALALGGLILQALELSFLNRYFDTPMDQDYVIGTYFLGLGAFLISLSTLRFLAGKWIAFFGRHTLGVYCVHYIYVDLLEPVDKIYYGPSWDIWYVVLVTALSLSTALIAAHSPLLRKYFV